MGKSLKALDGADLERFVRDGGGMGEEGFQSSTELRVAGSRGNRGDRSEFL